MIEANEKYVLSKRPSTGHMMSTGLFNDPVALNKSIPDNKKLYYIQNAARFHLNIEEIAQKTDATVLLKSAKKSMNRSKLNISCTSSKKTLTSLLDKTNPHVFIQRTTIKNFTLTKPPTRPTSALNSKETSCNLDPVLGTKMFLRSPRHVPQMTKIVTRQNSSNNVLIPYLSFGDLDKEANLTNEEKKSALKKTLQDKFMKNMNSKKQEMERRARNAEYELGIDLQISKVDLVPTYHESSSPSPPKKLPTSPKSMISSKHNMFRRKPSRPLLLFGRYKMTDHKADRRESPNIYII
jgi:hypothetical protein